MSIAQQTTRQAQFNARNQFIPNANSNLMLLVMKRRQDDTDFRLLPIVGWRIPLDYLREEEERKAKALENGSKGDYEYYSHSLVYYGAEPLFADVEGEEDIRSYTWLVFNSASNTNPRRYFTEARLWDMAVHGAPGPQNAHFNEIRAEFEDQIERAYAVWQKCEDAPSPPSPPAPPGRWDAP